MVQKCFRFPLQATYSLKARVFRTLETHRSRLLPETSSAAPGRNRTFTIFCRNVGSGPSIYKGPEAKISLSSGIVGVTSGSKPLVSACDLNHCIFRSELSIISHQCHQIRITGHNIVFHAILIDPPSDLVKEFSGALDLGLLQLPHLHRRLI